MSSSGFSVTSLQAFHAIFNSDIKYNSITFTNPNNGNQSILPLASFIGNPNYSAFDVAPNILPTIYNGYVSSFNTFVNDVLNNNTSNSKLGPTNIRLQVIMADGNVFYDSSKGNKNTYANFLDRAINENHGTRHYIQQAFHSKNGVGWETKWSSSSRGFQTYYAVRLGMTEHAILGVVVISYSNSY